MKLARLLSPLARGGIAAAMAALGGCGLFPDLSSYGECASGAACGGGGGATQSSSVTSGASTSTAGTTAASSTSAASSSASGMMDPCALTPTMHGSEGVHVVSAFPAFCIDRTEVSVGQYRDFLENHVGNDLLPSEFPLSCTWKTNAFAAFEPKGAGGMNDYLWTHYDAKTKEDRPVQGVDWCDAQIYCLWAGKHLCRDNSGMGAIDSTGGPNVAWLKSGQWYRACSGAAQTNYGYGNTYDPTQCNTESMGDATENNPFKTTAVTLPATCKAAWPDGDVFDMNGNVMEWEDNCEATGTPGPEDDTCYPRGGSYNLQQYTSCDFVDDNSPHRRDLKGEYLGFRCCW
ncbi:MAG: SUMF1/EgtB/PvdO family nonheme iron enzyme [Polyangiaceae bacterium]